MEDYQEKPKNKFRRRKVFSIGIIITKTTIEWTGKWFKFVEIEEQLVSKRFKKFDEWNGTFYWGDWYSDWEFVKTV